MAEKTIIQLVRWLKLHSAGSIRSGLCPVKAEGPARCVVFSSSGMDARLHFADAVPRKRTKGIRQSPRDCRGLERGQRSLQGGMAKAIKIKQTKLLSDFWPHGNVAKSLGLFREQNGFSQRANVVLDQAGKVCFLKVYPIKELPDIDGIIAFLKNA